jgi:hypothetical protein
LPGSFVTGFDSRGDLICGAPGGGGGGGGTPGEVLVSPLQLDFGQTRVGTVSDALYLTFTNTGTTDVTLAITFSGANFLDFYVGGDSSCNSLLAKGTCSLAMVFAPTGPDLRTAEMRVQTPTGDTIIVPLAGFGT